MRRVIQCLLLAALFLTTATPDLLCRLLGLHECRRCYPTSTSSY